MLVRSAILAGFLGSAVADFHLDVHLKHANLDALETQFWDIATPGNHAYLQFLSLGDLASLIGADESSIKQVSDWLMKSGATGTTTSNLRDTVTAHFADSSLLTLTANGLPHSKTHPEAVAGIVRRDPVNDESAGIDHAAHLIDDVDYSMHILDIADTAAAPDYSISNIKAAYQMPADLQATNDATTQMVWGPGTFGYSKSKLRIQKAAQAPLINMDKVIFDTENEGQSGGDNFGEGQLDVNMITSFGLNVTTLVSNTNTTASTEETTGFGAALLDFLTDLANRETVPHVLSMSLGSLSAASCDLLCSEAVKMGHTAEECSDYMATQRQVCMFLSQDQTDRINTALQVLGARGVTVMGSSGDGGSHFSFGSFSGGSNGISDDLNSISCKNQIPVFPTASPYVLSIGGEMWDGDSSKPITWAGYGGGSGGGFSIQFDAPEHQKNTVADYLAKDGMPGGFDPSKRAYPDISAVGVSGTSQSCPITAGIISQIIDMRLNNGLGGLGFVAPRIYAVAEQFPGEAFEDIVGGNSCTSCGEENGFPATEGWDANTGWGRPIWPGMVKHFASDE